MKKILFICSRVPYPPIGGNRSKNYHLLKKLSLRFKITTLIITSEKVSNEALAFLESVSTPIIFEKTKIDFLKNILLAAFRLPLPIQAGLYYFRDVQKCIDDIIKDHDALFCNLIRTTHYAEKYTTPKICDMADSIGQNYRNSYKQVKSRILSIYYFIESYLLLKYEEKIAHTFNKTLLFNQKEIASFQNQKRLMWIPHGVNEELLDIPPPCSHEKAIAFLGKMDYQPNIDAVLWFVEHVLPKIDPTIKFYIVGANPSSKIQELQSAQITVTGFVTDPFPLLSKMSAIVAPMQTGGGIQNKVLEMMALAKLNIISPLAANPMFNLVDYKHAIIATTVDDWTNAIHHAAENTKMAMEIGQQARQYIIENYTWSACARYYSNAIDSITE